MILNSDFTIVYLSLGSNIEPKIDYLKKASNIIQKKYPDQFQSSSIYSSLPHQSLGHSDYLNQSIAFATTASAHEILHFCQETENQLGRKRTGQWGADRTIDIDILLFGDCIIHEKNLIVPHYDLENRDFFLVPLLEINPHLIHSKINIALQDLLEKLDTSNSLYRFNEI